MPSYADARPLISSGDLLAWSDCDLVARAIRLWTQSTWDHVGIAWRFRDRLFVLEATLSGVGLRALSLATPFDWIATSAKWTDDVEAFALAQLGRPYDVYDAIRVGLGVKPSSAGEICSLYAAEVIAATGATSFLRKGLTPQALVATMLYRGCELRRVTG